MFLSCRYQVLVQPLRSLAGRPTIWRKVVGAWIFAFIFAVPQLFIFVQTDEGIKPDGTVRHLCRSQGYTAQWQRKVYFTFLTTYILIIPFIIMSFCYLNIIRVVWKRVEEKPSKPKLMIRFKSFNKGSKSRSVADSDYGTNSSDICQNSTTTASDLDALPQRCYQRRPATTCHNNKIGIPKKLISNSKRNVVKMTLSVIIAFLICWSPYFIFSLVRIYSNYKIELKEGLMIAEIMALVHSALNPMLYGIFSTKYTKVFFRRVCRCLCCGAGGLSKFDDGVSEDDTSWRETTRYSIVNVNQKGARQDKSCQNYCRTFLNFLFSKCGCKYVFFSKKADTSGGFYQELVPNGHYKTSTSNHRNNIEMDSDIDSNIEALNAEHATRINSSHRVRRSTTVSLVLSNPDPSSRRNDYISTV